MFASFNETAVRSAQPAAALRAYSVTPRTDMIRKMRFMTIIAVGSRNGPRNAIHELVRWCGLPKTHCRHLDPGPRAPLNP